MRHIVKISALFIILIFISCKDVVYFKRIEIPTDEIKEVENAMTTVIKSLDKSTFDTLKIKEYTFKCSYENNLLYSTSTNHDSIYKNTQEEFDFDTYKPFKKDISLYNSSMFFNNRDVAKDFADFSRKINDYNELSNFSPDEKKEFINSFKILISNNINSCYKVNNKYYTFRYSTCNIFHGENFETYLYLKNSIVEIKKSDEFKSSRIFIEEKGNLVLYKGLK